MTTDGGLGGLLGDVLVLGIAYKMTDGFGTQKNNNNNNNNNNQQEQPQKKTRLHHAMQTKKTNVEHHMKHSSTRLQRKLYDPDNPTPF